jgi:hypothetical protein
MFGFLFQMSDAAVFLFLTFIFVSVSIIGVFLVKKFLPLHIRYKDDTVIGATSSVISVMFGVLAGFSALYLFNVNSSTSDAVQREANAVANLYRDSQFTNAPIQIHFKQDIIDYLNVVLKDDWNQMSSGNNVSTKGNTIITSISKEIQAYMHASAKPDSEITRALLVDIRDMYNARQQRINLSTQVLSPEVWEVLVIGAVLTLCINFLFGMNFYLHIAAVIAAALMISSVMFLLVTLNYPFQGEFIILPAPFQTVLDQVSSDK